jgi:DNA-directed RNA polymerase I, II, and III subunit RPABC1
MVAQDEPMEESGVTSAPTLRGGLTPEASRLFRVYKTISAMLKKRGYMVPREMREMTPADFTNKFGEHPSRESLTILVVSFYHFWKNMHAHKIGARLIIYYVL